MFGIQFYPTPPNVAKKMVEPYADLIKSGAYVLDPSAGSGNLLDVATYSLYGHATRKFDHCFAVEIDPDLQAVLRQKKIKVIGDDWLKYASHYHFDIILMNPPFANGDEHLLKAWEVLRGGHIACLVNAETIRNPFTARRELLADIIEKHGSVEFLGDCFAGAERSTNVDVALVRLHKPAPNRFGFEGVKTSVGGDNDFTAAMDSMPARRDLIGSLVTSYDAVSEALEAYIRADLRLRSLTADFWRDFYKSQTEKDHLESMHQQGNAAGYFNSYMDTLKRAAWHQVFQRTNMQALMTDRVRKDWEVFQAQQGAAEFTHDNIMAFFDMLIVNRNQILHQCVVDVFDRMCSFDKKNKVHTEGWKTNSAYKVNRRVILPYFISNHSGSWGTTLSVNSRYWDMMDDIDRAMCLVSGKSFGNVTTFRSALHAAIRGDNGSPGEGESEFFTFRYFLKGTVHLTFKDEQVWKAFNRRAGEGKGWIGDGE